MLIKPKRSFNNWINISEGIEFLCDYPTREQSQKLQSIMFDDRKSEQVRMIEYTQYFVKCVVKDWKGIDDKCVLVNNELENELWWRVVEDATQALSLWNIINEELQFTETDKKKLD